MSSGQVSLEFIIVMSFAVLMLVSLIVIGADQLSAAVDEQSISVVHDTCLVIQQELVTAASVHDGYFRNFTLPQTILRQSYTIEMQNTSMVSVITVHSAKRKESIRTPLCNGTLQPGSNTIRKENSRLWCNQ